MRRMLSAALVTACALLATPSFADEPKTLAESLTGRAKDEYLAGRTLFGDRDFGGALVKFKVALDASSDPRLLWNLGSCERNLRHYAQALRYFERYRVEAATQLTDKDRVEVDAIVSALRPFVAALTVHADQEGAAALIDDEPAGNVPVDKRYVDLGQHRLVLRKSGFAEYAAPISVTGNGDILLDVHLVPAPHEGRLSVHAGEGDAIALDGKSVAAGAFDATVPSGDHLVRVTAPGKKPYEGHVAVSDGQVRTLDVTLERASTVPWMWIGIGAGAVAAVSIGAAILLSSSSSAKSASGASPVIGTMPPGTVQLP